jgi:adenylylsulfate kinase
MTRVLWLNGTVGAGKTTVGATIADLLASRGEAVAFVDIDALGAAWPRSPDDPFNTRLVADNLAAVVANFAAAGVRSLVVAGVIQDGRDLDRYQRAIGVAITLVRLVAQASEIEDRLRRRHGEVDPSGLRWHVDRAPTLAAILDDADLPMLDVRNIDHPDETALAVISSAGWHRR